MDIQQNRRDFLKKSAFLTMGMMVSSCATSALEVQPGGDVNLSAARIEKIRQSPNFDGEIFRNCIATDTGLKPGKQWEALRKWVGGDQVRVPQHKIPVVKPDFSAVHAAIENRATAKSSPLIILTISNISLLLFNP